MTSKSNDILMPKGLSKARKSAFSRVVEMRKSAGDPVKPIEVDAVLDYVDARARLVQLQRLQNGELAPYFVSDKIALIAAIDRAASSCRRLGRDLRLFSKASA